MLIKKTNHWIDACYGSRRGFVRSYWFRLLYFFGKYKSYQNIDWCAVERLVFVCKGNICRSAFAEVVARSQGVKAVSCGIDTIENSLANKDAMKMAENLGFELAEHKTTPVMYLVLKKTDLLVVMEPWQAEFLNKNLYRAHQYTLLGLWSQSVSPHIQDPYGANSAYFKRCFVYIQGSVDELIKKIEK